MRENDMSFGAQQEQAAIWSDLGCNFARKDSKKEVYVADIHGEGYLLNRFPV